VEMRVMCWSMLAHCLSCPIVCICSPEARQKMSAARKVSPYSDCLLAVVRLYPAALPQHMRHRRHTACLTSPHRAHPLGFNMLHSQHCCIATLIQFLPTLPGLLGANGRLLSRVAPRPVRSGVPPALEPGRAVPHELLAAQQEASMLCGDAEQGKQCLHGIACCALHARSWAAAE